MRICKVNLGEAVPYVHSHGDLWTSTWADDDALYCASDDTTGFDQACSSNLAINRITGKTPPDLQGTTINPMQEFGGWGEFLEDDRAMWKANGLTCVDGVLYLSVSRHGNLFSNRFSIQQAWDASILKSEDHGQTWSAAPQLDRSMFPGHTFATPFFVEYGQNGRAEVDQADSYIYAVSSDGVWNNGSSMTLGRVRRDRMAQLEPADWEFVRDFDEQGQPLWGPRHSSAQYIFRAPGRTSMTGIHFIAPLDVYILPQWHYTHLESSARRWTATRWELYQASTPWGPWALLHTQDFEPQGWYNPTIPSKFIGEDGRSMWIFTAGDWTTCNEPDGERYYSLWMIPMTLDVEPR